MKGLDTNVLVRYLTEDDPRQARIAAQVIERSADQGEKLLIQPLVLCELVWVLEGAYGFSKGEIVKTLDAILRTAQFEISEKDTVWLALSDYAREKGDFADHYIGRANERDGAESTLTFDKSLKQSKRFKLL